MHAAFALLVAMAEGDTTGRGHFVECSMLEAALNITAEQVIEYTANAHLMERQGNRSLEAAPQGLFGCQGHDISAHPQWIALSVETDAQWAALVEWLGHPDWATRVAGDLASRRQAEETLVECLAGVFSDRDAEECVGTLTAVGVPAALVVDPRGLAEHPQFRARRFMEEVDHPVAGLQPTMTPPFRYKSVARWLTRAAPVLGQHNAEILEELGYTVSEIESLAAQGVIGDWPAGLE